MDVLFESLVVEPLIPCERLQEPPFGSFSWGIRMSGVRLPPDIAAALKEEWERVAPDSLGHPEEFRQPPRTYREGSLRRVYVNVYERNPAARAQCIAHHGLRCSVCEMSFLEKYGPVAGGLIHVHHLVPLSGINEEYEIDPVHDLRPVCPSCHAVIHLRTPPYEIEEVQQLLSNAGAQQGSSRSQSA